MGNIRKRHSASFKFKVALEAAKENKTLNELASQFEIHPTQIAQWKKQFLENGSGIFSSKTNNPNQNLINHLYEEIGKLTTEINWFKKKLS